MTKATTLLTRLRKELHSIADPAKAEPMRAYMKSEMHYLGIPAPVLRPALKQAFAGLSYKDSADWQNDVLAIWRGAKHREERYAAVELTGIRAARPFQTMDVLPMYEEMIVSGAWWDYVDALASNRVGPIVRAFSTPGKKLMRAWSKCPDMWKRRTSIICQLGAGDETDIELLYACIEPSIESKEFFLRKAIGWALRQYARIDGAEVLRYVTEKRAVLSPLSKREALKAGLRSGEIERVP